MNSKMAEVKQLQRLPYPKEKYYKAESYKLKGRGRCYKIWSEEDYKWLSADEAVEAMDFLTNQSIYLMGLLMKIWESAE